MAEGTVWKHLVTIKPLVNFQVFTVESCQFDHRPGRNNKVVALMQEYPTEPLYKIPARQAEFEVFNVIE